MLSAGFKFMCCSTEDDADNPKITWNENLLSMQNLQIRQEEINNQVTLTFVAFNNEVEEKPEKKFSKDFIPKNRSKKKILSSLATLSKATGTNVLELLENLNNSN